MSLFTTKKFAVCTLAIGEEYKLAVEPSQQTKRDYCSLHGYDYIDDESVYDKSRPIAWSKLLLIKKYLPKYDYVVWIDADAIIMDLTQKLEDKIYLMDDKDLMVISDFYQINSGVIFVKNTPKALEFIDTWYNKEEYINVGDWDQAALINMYKNKLDNIDNVLKVNTFEVEKYIQVYWFSYRPGFFILHLAGYGSGLNQLANDIRRYCPIRMSTDTDESYASRIEWLKSGVVDYIRSVLGQ